jgi:sporulation protein YlmC with PRC-barrel domain
MAHRFNIKVGDLLRTSVVDAEGVRVGIVEDVWLDEDGEIWLIVGGNAVQETLAKLHIRPEIDLLVPSEAVARRTDDHIELKWSRFELESTCEQCWTRQKEHLVYAATNEPDRFPFLRLGMPHI